MVKKITECPSCKNKLQVVTLKCNNCGLELHNEFEEDIFDSLSNEQNNFLITFLKNRGNMKLLQNELNISYPYAKKKLDELLKTLNLLSVERGEENMKNIKVINTQDWMVDTKSSKASDIIKTKLKENNGKAVVTTLEGKTYEIVALADGETFFCEALPIAPYSYKVFDDIVELLINQGGKAQKGNARNYKVGEEKCDENTVVGAIGINYFKKSYGDSTFDPVFIMAAVLEWANIAHNLRGYIELTQEYKNKIYFR